jgi:hypothetical protein
VGQQVFVTDEGFRPDKLTATVSEEIAFFNETDSAVTIELDGGALTATLEKGECVVYVPNNAVALGYKLAEDPSIDGFIQVEPFFDESEDPGGGGRLDADAPKNRFPSCSHPRG